MRFAASAAFALAALSAGPALAQKAARLDRAAAPRAWLAVAAFFDLNADCSHVAYPRLRLLSGPSAGRVSFSRGRGTPAYPAGSSREKCNGTRPPAMIAWYRSHRGFVGTDHFVFEINWDDGEQWTRDVSVEVR